MTLYKWNQSAASDTLADATCPWPEGMAPASVNDSARGMMAAVAKYRDDIAGAIVTAGTSAAYTVSSYEIFDTLPHLSGQMIAFTPHVTNAATVTLNVDGLGAKPLRTSPGVELPAGTIIQGTPYIATYNNADGAFYLHGFYGNPYNIPLGASLPFFLPTAPNSLFVFPFGQAISRTTYSALYALMANTYGAGDGSTTFNLPDLRGRALAGLDNMGGSAAGRLTAAGSGIDAVNLSAAGGTETVTLTTAQLASHTHTGTTGTESATHTHNSDGYDGGAVNAGGGVGGGKTTQTNATSTQSANHTHNFTSNSAGSDAAHRNVQPTIVCNYIMRII